MVAVVDVTDEGEGVGWWWTTHPLGHEGAPDGGVPGWPSAHGPAADGSAPVLELRSAWTSTAGRTPVRLEFDGPGGRTLTRSDGSRSTPTR